MNPPASWADVGLLDVCELNPPETVEHGNVKVDYLSFSSIDDLGGTITATHERLFDEVPRGTSVFREGDVLFAGITAEQWVSALVGVLPNGIGISPQLTVLRPGPQLSASYLWHFFQQPWLRKQASARNASTHAQPVISHSFFRNLRIALPSIEEQTYIVNCLNKAGVQPYREAQERVNHLKATLEERLMLPAVHALEPDWEFIRLADICGINPSDDQMGSNSVDDTQEVTFLSRTNLRTQQTAPQVVRFCDMPNPAREVQPGDLLYGAEPSTVTYGGVFVVPDGHRPTFAARTMTVLTPNERVSTRYLETVLRSRWFNHPPANHGVSVLRGQSISGRLRRRKLMLPPLARQHQIVTILDAVPDAAIAEMLLKSRVIYHALARDAFNGRLFKRAPIAPIALIEQQAANADIIDLIAPAASLQPRSPVPFTRARRRGLVDSLSKLQRLVWRAVRTRTQVLIVDNPDSFEAFCASTTLAPFGKRVSPSQIRRTLEQIAAIGLIQKMNLPHLGMDDAAAYLLAFRAYREVENGRIREDTAVLDAKILFASIDVAERES